MVVTIAYTNNKVVAYPVGLHNSCLCMSSVFNSSGDPGIKTFICKHPCTVHRTIELNAVHNVVKKVHGDNLSTLYIKQVINVCDFAPHRYTACK